MGTRGACAGSSHLDQDQTRAEVLGSPHAVTDTGSRSASGGRSTSRGCSNCCNAPVPTHYHRASRTARNPGCSSAMPVSRLGKCPRRRRAGHPDRLLVPERAGRVRELQRASPPAGPYEAWSAPFSLLPSRWTLLNEARRTRLASAGRPPDIIRNGSRPPASCSPKPAASDGCCPAQRSSTTTCTGWQRVHPRRPDHVYPRDAVFAHP